MRRRTTPQLDLPMAAPRRADIGTTILWADDSGRRLAAFAAQHRACTIVTRVTPNGYQCLRCANCRSEVWSRVGADPGEFK